MQDLSILVGGITGSGINETGITIARLFNRLGYHIYMYYDYPSRVRGGHSFALLRIADHPISAHSDEVDVVLALDQETIRLHQAQWLGNTVIIYDSDLLSIEAGEQPKAGIPITHILQQEGAPPDYRTVCMTGALCKILGIDLALYEQVLQKHTPIGLEQKMKVARRGYDSAEQIRAIDKLNNPALPVLNGNHAISLGLVKAGLQAYVAYPMTPTSPLLEYLASSAPEFGLQVILPESEIAVMIMALGYAYMGIKTAVGTSGGGFSLMVEGLGLAGQAELPVVVVMGQRSGPSTGMPTYTAQSDLLFVLNASQGEFPRFIVAPGDAEESYYWSGIALNKAWQYQMPSFVLTDKTLGLGLFNLDLNQAGELQEETSRLWDGQGEYRRYANAEQGVSPLAFPPLPEQVVKTNSYVHDERGITSDDPGIATAIANKRLLKEKYLAEDLANYETVKVYGSGPTALLCWGSNKGVCVETAQKLGLKVIQMLVLSPFPLQALAEALAGVAQLIGVECNATGQLAILLQQHGFKVDKQILKYDGRPFSLQDLEKEVKKVII
jgi:2-oxoglutarate ferredoxin oxidoreductase subunit alpha